MKRTTIFIPEPLEADLRVYARRAKKPVAWVVREAVSTYLTTRATPTMLPSSVGMGNSGRSDISERFEELLFADLTPHDDRVEGSTRARRAGRRRRKPTW